MVCFVYFVCMLSLFHGHEILNCTHNLVFRGHKVVFCGHQVVFRAHAIAILWPKLKFVLTMSCLGLYRFLRQLRPRMKRLFNREARGREFKPGDKVLELLLIPGSSLQARY